MNQEDPPWTRRVVAAVSAVPSAGLPRRAYTVQAVSPLGGGGSRVVACHSDHFPYAVYQCHMAGLSSKAYVISICSGLRADPAIAMTALCHHDTSNWNPAHPAFEDTM